MNIKKFLFDGIKWFLIKPILQLKAVQEIRRGSSVSMVDFLQKEYKKSEDELVCSVNWATACLEKEVSQSIVSAEVSTSDLKKLARKIARY